MPRALWTASKRPGADVQAGAEQVGGPWLGEQRGEIRLAVAGQLSSEEVGDGGPDSRLARFDVQESGSRFGQMAAVASSHRKSVATVLIDSRHVPLEHDRRWARSTQEGRPLISAGHLILAGQDRGEILTDEGPQSRAAVERNVRLLFHRGLHHLA